MSFFDDAGRILAQVAPTIASAVGGPAAGLGVRALISVLGLDEGTKTEDVMKAVAGATPDQLLAIKKADQDFAVRMEELGIDLERIAAADRDSARKREAQTGDKAVPALAFIIMGGFFATCAAVLSGYSAVDSTIVGAIIGYVSAKAEQVVAYYFGSSLGSKLKTALIGKTP